MKISRSLALLCLGASGLALAACKSTGSDYPGNSVEPPPAPVDDPLGSDRGEPSRYPNASSPDKDVWVGDESAAPLPGNPETCATGALNDFDWPPPEPSTSVAIPRALLLMGVDAEDQTLETVAQRLERALVDAGYVEFGYQAVGCNGFALVTRMEQIDEDGEPLQGTARFEPPNDAEPWSLGGFIRQLIGAPPGYYRQIVFVATDRLLETTGEAATRDELDTMMSDATEQELPPEMAGEPYTSTHKLHVLVYEFEKRRDENEAIQLTPSRLTGAAHVQAAGIYEGLSDE